MLKQTILALSLVTPLFASSQEICVEIELNNEECFLDIDESMQFLQKELEAYEYLEAVKGKVGSDRPNMRELMKAAVDALGSRGFQGEITVEVTTPSGYIFKVIVKGGTSGKKPRRISKPNQ